MLRPLIVASLATCLVTAAFPHRATMEEPLSAGALRQPSSQTAGRRFKQDPTASATGPRATHAEIRAFFDEYLRLHEAQDMNEWPKLFLDGATIVRTGSDGRVLRYSPADLAARIAAEAAQIDSQHETFHDIRIEADGDAAMYSTHWKLFHNGALVREGRAWFLLARDDGHWRIASLVWYNH
jgi:ketosteroid isomerase-like protein